MKIISTKKYDNRIVTQEYKSTKALKFCFGISGRLLQRRFYRRDKHFHFIHGLIVCDTRKHIVYCRAGFTGRLTDADVYHTAVPPPLPPRLELMGDAGFPEIAPLFTPHRRPRRQNFNKRRVTIEHVIGKTKIFQGVGTRRYRGCRHLLPILFNIACALKNQRDSVISSLRVRYRVILGI